MIRLKDLKSVDIVFENCDVVSIPIEYVDHITLDEITTAIRVDFGKAISYNDSKHTKIILKAAANDLHTVYDPDIKLFDRILKFDDITAIDLLVDDNESNHYYVDWCYDNEYMNKYQHNKIMDNGDLIIYIGEKFEDED